MSWELCRLASSPQVSPNQTCVFCTGRVARSHVVFRWYFSCLGDETPPPEKIRKKSTHSLSAAFIVLYRDAHWHVPNRQVLMFVGDVYVASKIYVVPPGIPWMNCAFSGHEYFQMFSTHRPKHPFMLSLRCLTPPTMRLFGRCVLCRHADAAPGDTTRDVSTGAQCSQAGTTQKNGA